MLVRSVIVFGYGVLAIGDGRLGIGRPSGYWIAGLKTRCKITIFFWQKKIILAKKISTTVDNFSKSVSITNSPVFTLYTLHFTLYASPPYAPSIVVLPSLQGEKSPEWTFDSERPFITPMEGKAQTGEQKAGGRLIIHFCVEWGDYFCTPTCSNGG